MTEEGQLNNFEFNDTGILNDTSEGAYKGSFLAEVDARKIRFVIVWTGDNLPPKKGDKWKLFLGCRHTVILLDGYEPLIACAPSDREDLLCRIIMYKEENGFMRLIASNVEGSLQESSYYSRDLFMGRHTDRDCHKIFNEWYRDSINAFAVNKHRSYRGIVSYFLYMKWYYTAY